jgi:hypothetical protein
MPKAKPKDERHRMVIISDTHAGYKYGLVPPSWRAVGGADVDATLKFQEYLYECWSHFVDSCPPAELLVINGDAIHGEDRKDIALNVVSSDMFEQAQMFLELLAPLRAKCDRVWLLKGTPYHEGRGADVIEWIGKEIDAEKWQAGRYSGYSLCIDWHDLGFGFAHHQTRGWRYAAGGADRTAWLQQSAEGQGKLPKADVIVRSHLHMQRIVWARDKWVIGTPGWTVVSPWAAKVMEHSRAHESSDIGGLVLTTTGKKDLGFQLENYKPFQEKVRDA